MYSPQAQNSRNPNSPEKADDKFFRLNRDADLKLVEDQLKVTNNFNSGVKFLSNQLAEVDRISLLSEALKQLDQNTAWTEIPKADVVDRIRNLHRHSNLILRNEK